MPFFVSPRRRASGPACTSASFIDWKCYVVGAPRLRQGSRIFSSLKIVYRKFGKKSNFHGVKWVVKFCGRGCMEGTTEWIFRFVGICLQTPAFCASCTKNFPKPYPLLCTLHKCLKMLAFVKMHKKLFYFCIFCQL